MESLGLYFHASNASAVPFAGDVGACQGPWTLSDVLILLTFFYLPFAFLSFFFLSSSPSSWSFGSTFSSSFLLGPWVTQQELFRFGKLSNKLC